MGILSPRLWRGSSRIVCKEEVTDSAGEVLVILASSGEYSRHQGTHPAYASGNTFDIFCPTNLSCRPHQIPPSHPTEFLGEIRLGRQQTSKP